MNTTSDAPGDDNDAGKLLAIVNMVGLALDKTSANQADALRTQSDANVRMAEIESQKQVEIAKMNAAAHLLSMKIGAWFMAGLLILLVVLIGGAFWTNHHEIATHTVAAVGSGVAGWLAGRAKR